MHTSTYPAKAKKQNSQGVFLLFVLEKPQWALEGMPHMKEVVHAHQQASEQHKGTHGECFSHSMSEPLSLLL